MNRQITAAFLSALLLSAPVYPVPQAMAGDVVQPAAVPFVNQWKGKRVAFLGDSITDKRQMNTTKCYWAYLAEMLGLVPSVYGISGHQMDDILGQAERLLKAEGDSIDAIIIFAGTNDFNSSVPLGEWYTEGEQTVQVRGGGYEKRKHRELLMDENTFRGRINRALDFLKLHFPTKQIILLTPIHRAYARFSDTNVQPDEHFANATGAYFDQYVAAVKEAGNVWAVPVIDLNSLCGLYPLSEPHGRYFRNGQTDRLHPNTAGHERMAKALFYQLLALPV